jgi:hypothetical protein
MAGSLRDGLKRRARLQRRSRGLGPWLAPAALAHVALLVAFALFGARPRQRNELSESPRARTADAMATLGIELVEEGEPALHGAAETHASDPGPAAHGAGAVSTVAPALAGLRREPSGAEAHGAARSLPRPSSAPAAGGATENASRSPETGGLGEAAAGAAPSGEPESAAPQLSLRDLGIGGGNSPFLGGPEQLPTQRQLLNQRLRQSLRADLARHDQRRGLGPEGPAVAAIKEIVLASATAPNTSALLRLRTNAVGEVTFVEVLDADRDDAEWRRIAEQLRTALAGKRLRVPPRSGGVSFQLRVVSKVQLPSGADPGLAVDLFGIRVKEGEGDKSTKLSVLSPALKELTVPGSDGATILVPTLSLFALAGDPVDIGSVARRLVTAYLVAMDTETPLEPPPALPALPAAPSPSAP